MQNLPVTTTTKDTVIGVVVLGLAIYGAVTIGKKTVKLGKKIFGKKTVTATETETKKSE